MLVGWRFLQGIGFERTESPPVSACGRDVADRFSSYQQHGPGIKPVLRGAVRRVLSGTFFMRVTVQIAIRRAAC